MSVYRYSALAFTPVQTSASQPAPTVLPTRVSFQVTVVAATANDDEDGDTHEESDGDETPDGHTNSVPAYENEPLISPKATPPVTYSRFQGFTSQPMRPRIEESDFC